MNDFIYIVNFRRLGIWLLPLKLRKLKNVAFLECLLQPIKELYTGFLSYRNDTLYKIEHTSQVCYIEAVLNDAFDKTQRRIYIKNGLFIVPFYVYTEPEDKPFWIYSENENNPFWIYTENDLNNNDADFIVCIPIDLKPANASALNAYIAAIEAEINYYKLASKTYIIQWII